MPSSGTSLSADGGAAVESFLFDWADAFDVPGAAAVIVTPEEEIVGTAVGSRELQSNEPATPDTLYAVGSVTKSFTATAIMQLVEDDRIELDESPRQYTDASFNGVEDVTIHSLLCHNSGLPSLAVSESLIAQQTDYCDPSIPIGDRGDFYEFLNGAGDERVDDDRFLYSNSGYMLLADIVASVHDSPFHEVIESEILAPLGMERSTMVEEVFLSDANTMTPYRRSEDGDRWKETPMPVRALSRGPGGLFTSPRELARYLQMYLTDGTNADGDRILSPASIDAMTDAHVDTPAGPYGYAWRTVDLDGSSITGHGGSVGVATAYAGWSRDLGLGVAVACNAAPGHGLRMLGTALAQVATGADPYETHHFFRQYRRRQQLIGSYESYRGARTATIETGDGFLRFTLEDPLPLSPTSLVFDEETADGYRYWTPTDDGRMPVEFIVDGSDVEVLYDRFRLYKVSQ